MTKEMTVILKDAERTYKEKFLIYGDIEMNANDTEIQGALSKAKQSFLGEPEDIIINVKMVLR